MRAEFTEGNGSEYGSYVSKADTDKDAATRHGYCRSAELHDHNIARPHFHPVA